MTTSDYINRAFRPEPGRKYYNHLAKQTRGEWHRNWLLASGQYVKTSERDQAVIDTVLAALRKFVGEPGPELVKFRADHLTADSGTVTDYSRYLSDPEYRRWVRAKCLDEMED